MRLKMDLSNIDGTECGFEFEGTREEFDALLAKSSRLRKRFTGED